MAQASRTFRIFVSSTFSDLKAERNALQQTVFPRLRELCLQHGCRFQAIDLRWGVSEEAALDQQTMKICLEEIKRCQRATPRPNFIVLLGDRYGWRPLPAEIPADEFVQIEAHITEAQDKTLLANWYKRDDNAVPAVYCLQPRAVPFRDDPSEQEAARQTEADEWSKTEQQLRRMLRAALAGLPFTAAQRLKYEASATEQEIMAGALNDKITDARAHVFGFLRSFKTLPQDASAKEFVDLHDDGTPDSEAHTRLEALKERLRQQLPGNISNYETEWTGADITTAHLPQLCADVYQSLSQVILAEIGQLEAANPIEEEAHAHERFGAERARFFTGRTNYLQAISDYIKAADPHPFAIYGASGSGKSALLAQAIAECGARNADWVLVSRFIGATPNSSDGRALLESLCRQIARRYGADETSVPAEYQKLVEELPRSLALATADKPLIVFLDALDQLSDFEHARNLLWLPRDLPAHVRLIVSTLDPGECLTQLERTLPAANLVKLEPMPKEEGGKLLDLWLAEAGRSLQDEQRAEVLGKFAANGLPLYLKLAFEEARRWRSYSLPMRLGADIPGIVRELFRRLSADHGQMLVSRSLGYLAAAKNGLTEDELLDVLSLDNEVFQDFKKRARHEPPEPRLPVVVWSRLYFDLESYLTERRADDANLLAFIHRQFREVAKEDYLAGDEKQDRHRRLARYFGGQLLQIKRGEKEIPNVRKLAELPFQQIRSELWLELERTLCDLRFAETKCIAGMLYDLQADYDAALSAENCLFQDLPSLQAFKLGVSGNAHLLKLYPELLFQQVANYFSSHFNDDEQKLILLLKSAESKERNKLWLRCLRERHKAVESIRTIIVSGVRELEFSSDSRFLCTWGGKTLTIWDISTGEEVAVAEEVEVDATERSKSARASQELIMVRPFEENIDPDWKGKSLTELLIIFKEHERQKYAFTSSHDKQFELISPDGKLVLTWEDKPSKVVLRDTHNKHQVAWWWMSSYPIVVFTPNSKFLIVGNGGSLFGAIHIWDSQGQKAGESLHEHKHDVECLAVSTDSNLLASSDGRGTVKLWNLMQKPRGLIKRTQGSEYNLHRVTAGSLSSTLGIAATGEFKSNSVNIWNATTMDRIIELETYCSWDPEHTRVKDIKFSPKGEFIAISTDDSLTVYETNNWSVLWENHSQTNCSLKFAPSGSVLATCMDNLLELWEARTGDLLAQFVMELGGGSSPIFSPNGSYLALVDSNGNLKIWKTSSWQEETRLRRNVGAGSFITFSPKGDSLLVLRDNELRTYDIGTMQEITSPLPNIPYITFQCIPYSESHVVSISGNLISLWDISTGQEVVVFPCSHKALAFDFNIQEQHLYTLDRGWSGVGPNVYTLQLWRGAQPYQHTLQLQ